MKSPMPMVGSFVFLLNSNKNIEKMFSHVVDDSEINFEINDINQNSLSRTNKVCVSQSKIQKL